jgi:hypothetical protein
MAVIMGYLAWWLATFILLRVLRVQAAQDHAVRMDSSDRMYSSTIRITSRSIALQLSAVTRISLLAIQPLALFECLPAAQGALGMQEISIP